MLALSEEEKKPFNRIKVKFTDGGYHIIEIPETNDIELLSPCVASYIEEARMFLDVMEDVEVEYVRALKVDEDMKMNE